MDGLLLRLVLVHLLVLVLHLLVVLVQIIPQLLPPAIVRHPRILTPRLTSEPEPADKIWTGKAIEAVA